MRNRGISFQSIRDRMGQWTCPLVPVLFFISVCWVLSVTLLNPDFFEMIIDTQEAQEFISALSEIAGQNGIVAKEPLIKENLISLIDGAIRYITVGDMSFSDISIDNESIMSLKSAYMPGTDIPDISRIHSFALSYFVPGVEKIYSYLHTARNIYAILKVLCPLSAIILLLAVFISGKTGKIIHAPFAIVSFLLIIAGLAVRYFHYELIISPAVKLLGESVLIIQPFISVLTFYLFIHFVFAGIFLSVAAALFKTQPVKRFFARCSRNAAVLFAIPLIVVLIISRHDFYSIVSQNTGLRQESLQVSTLMQDEGAIHSLMIRLLEEGSEEPAEGVRLIANKIDYPYNPLYTTSFSDSSGNVRFVLPRGYYLVYAHEPTLPKGCGSFDPVVLELFVPGNSFYTIYIPKKRITPNALKTQPSGMRPFPH